MFLPLLGVSLAIRGSVTFLFFHRWFFDDILVRLFSVLCGGTLLVVDMVNLGMFFCVDCGFCHSLILNILSGCGCGVVLDDSVECLDDSVDCSGCGDPGDYAGCIGFFDRDVSFDPDGSIDPGVLVDHGDSFDIGLVVLGSRSLSSCLLLSICCIQPSITKISSETTSEDCRQGLPQLWSRMV